MKKRYYKLALFLTLLATATGAQATPTPVVIGYLPSFRDMTSTIDSTDLSLLTHINISFANPDTNGDLIKNNVLQCMPNARGTPTAITDLQYVISKAHQSNVKVLVSVAGGVIPACSGNWQNLLKTSTRQLVIDNLLKFVDDYNLDGIDIDLEGELLTAIDRDGNYTPFIKSLSEKLIAKGKLLTCATASYQGGMIPVSSIPYFDFINVMSYDLIGPSWGTPGTEHSPLSMANSNLDTWLGRGVPQEKLILGVPFYGYGFGSYPSDFTYHDIIAKYGVDAAKKDLIGDACSGCSYITYNGAATIKAKTQLALQKAGGVMIWEITQDAKSPNSLLKTIHDTLYSSTTSSSSSAQAASSSQRSASSSSSIPSTPSAKGGSSGGAINLLSLVFLVVFGLIGPRK